jgi:hypothetical protein
MGLVQEYGDAAYILLQAISPPFRSPWRRIASVPFFASYVLFIFLFSVLAGFLVHLFPRALSPWIPTVVDMITRKDSFSAKPREIAVRARLD